MVVVYSAFGLEIDYLFETREDAIKWITDLAAAWNYGIYRTWTANGFEYFDVGPRVYCIKAQ